MIYLDHAATTPLDPRVLEAMLPYLTYEFGNPGSLHAYGRTAKEAVDRAREQVAALFACDPCRIIFTSGGTEGNNTVFAGLETELRRRGRTEVVISEIEHDSVWKAAHALCMKSDFHLRICPPNADGQITESAIREHISENTGLVSVMMTNNETGVINNLTAIGDFCRERGILVHSDCVQAAGIETLDTQHIYPSTDFMTVSSHKINGPKGVGALYALNPALLSPLIRGGAEQESGLRGGTENVPGIVGFGKACELVLQEQEKHFDYLSVQHRKLYFLLVSLAMEQGVDLRVNGDPEKSVPKTLNICLPGIDAQTLLLMLDDMGICLSAGSACRAHEDIPSRTLMSMGISAEDARSSLRISLSAWNSPEEIDQAARSIVSCAKALKGLRV